jgi:hypothetical protein
VADAAAAAEVVLAVAVVENGDHIN